MTVTTQQRHSPLGLFPDKPAPWLNDGMVQVLRVRHDSRRLEDAYVYWTCRYIQLHQRQHTRQLCEDDVNRFPTSLAVKEHGAASTHNQGLSATIFLCEHVLKQSLYRVEGAITPVVRSGFPSPVLISRFHASAA